jgi:hypothetical protein
MMSDDERPLGEGDPLRDPERGYVRFSARVARAVCARVAAGESLVSICSEPGLPSRNSLANWARRHPEFGRIFDRAKALAARKPVSGQGYCPATANEVVARVSQGEMLSTITADPMMPSLRTMYRWKADHPEFAEDMRLAREALAERFSDQGWTMALEATPETAFLTQVRLKQFRWMAAVLGPRTHARLKAYAPPDPPEENVVLFRHFRIEEHPETGQHRVVGYTPDPETLQPVRTSEGPWKAPLGPLEQIDPGMAASRQRLETWADED